MKEVCDLFESSTEAYPETYQTSMNELFRENN